MTHPSTRPHQKRYSLTLLSSSARLATNAVTSGPQTFSGSSEPTRQSCSCLLKIVIDDGSAESTYSVQRGPV